MSDKPAFSFSEPKGDFVVMTRDKCESYWQPIPANGHIDIMVSQRNVRSVHPFGRHAKRGSRRTGEAACSQRRRRSALYA